MTNKFWRRAAAEFGDSNGAFIHTLERARQRGGVALRPSDYRKALRSITTGQVPLVRCGERFQAIVRIRGKQMRAIYDADAQVIVTVLPW